MVIHGTRAHLPAPIDERTVKASPTSFCVYASMPSRLSTQRWPLANFSTFGSTLGSYSARSVAKPVASCTSGTLGAGAGAGAASGAAAAADDDDEPSPLPPPPPPPPPPPLPAPPLLSLAALALPSRPSLSLPPLPEAVITWHLT